MVGIKQYVATKRADLAGRRGRGRMVVSSTTIMSHALLLRLFLSPSYFSVHVALHYLMLYSDNIGITYYLTRRLKEFTIDELREVWGFIW